jgi:hypothetical protein
MKSFINVLIGLFIIPATCIGQLLLHDSFDNDLSAWEINNEVQVKIINSDDINHENVLVLTPNGNVSALIKNSEQWNALKMEGEMFFPSNKHNYLGFIYNYNIRQGREDFGLLYVKGNGSYIRVNPWRDGNVSRLLYEEYKTNLTGDQKVEIGVWHRFKIEVINKVCHLYINDMKIPKITFNHFEFSSGKLGFQPRVVGGEVWIDNIVVNSIQEFTYKGEDIPNIIYEHDSLITEWEVLGPLNKPNPSIERCPNTDTCTVVINGKNYIWKPFETDKRGCVVTGKITEYEGENTVAYFRTSLNAEQNETVKLHFTTIDELTLYINGRDCGRVYRDGYVSRDNDWNAWYDFWENINHAGRYVTLPLKKGKNELIIKVRNGQFASGGFFVRKVQ